MSEPALDQNSVPLPEAATEESHAPIEPGAFGQATVPEQGMAMQSEVGTAPDVLQEAYQPDAAHVQPQPAEDMSAVRPVPRVSLQAFCETDAVASVIDRASKDRRMAKAHVSVQTGGIAAAINYYQTATTPNLIIIESSMAGMDLVGQLHGLAEVCDEGTNVMVVGHHNDVQLYRELMTRGVSEYLVAPISMAELMNVVNELFVNPEAEPMGSSLSFIGAKGGVGSSTIAHNVAFTISSSFQSDVVLADLDLPFGTANIDFVLFRERWMVMEDTFRPPWYHKNIMSEMMGNIYGEYDAKPQGFVPGGVSLHNMMLPHGPDKNAFEGASNADLQAEKLDNTMSFMFETRFPQHLTEFAAKEAPLQDDYIDCWEDIEKKFDGTPGQK